MKLKKIFSKYSLLMFSLTITFVTLNEAFHPW